MSQFIIHCFELLIGCVLIYFCWLSGNQKVISEVVYLLPFQSSSFFCHIVLCILTNDLDAGGWCLRNNTKTVVGRGKSFLVLIKDIFEDPLFSFIGYIYSREFLPLDT